MPNFVFTIFVTPKIVNSEQEKGIHSFIYNPGQVFVSFFFLFPSAEMDFYLNYIYIVSTTSLCSRQIALVKALVL